MEFLRGLSPSEIEEWNQRQLKQAQQEHAEFSAAFKEGRCYLCGTELQDFVRIMPCLHWLLRPNGFSKSDFPAVVAAYGYRSISSYLRWVANEDRKAQNINDFADEGTGKLIEETIRYKQLEWSISCGNSDFEGHQTNSPASRVPHYHFQMRVNKKPFIRFNDFHVPFNAQDLVEIGAMRSAPDLIKRMNVGGEGMDDVLNGVPLEKLIEHGVSSDDEANAMLSISTMVLAPEGGTLSGDVLADIVEEAKRTGVTIASLLHKRLPEANIRTIVSPGDGVVEQAPRSGRGKGRKQTPSAGEAN